jgi:hypothetical protein
VQATGAAWSAEELPARQRSTSSGASCPASGASQAPLVGEPYGHRGGHALGDASHARSGRKIKAPPLADAHRHHRQAGRAASGLHPYADPVESCNRTDGTHSPSRDLLALIAGPTASYLLSRSAAASIVMAWACAGTAKSAAGFELNSEGQGCSDRDGICARGAEARQGWRGIPGQHTDPRSPTAEERRSRVDRLSPG